MSLIQNRFFSPPADRVPSIKPGLTFEKIDGSLSRNPDSDQDNSTTLEDALKKRREKLMQTRGLPMGQPEMLK